MSACLLGSLAILPVGLFDFLLVVSEGSLGFVRGGNDGSVCYASPLIFFLSSFF